MTSKTLKHIQTLAKVGKVLSTIVFVFCIVGAVGSVIGLISLGMTSIVTFRIEDMSFLDWMKEETKLAIGDLYAAISGGLVECLVGIVLASMAMKYFKSELQDGTPFTVQGAKRLMRLGLWEIFLPLGSGIIVSLIQTILNFMMDHTDQVKFDNSSSLAIGIAMLICALLCRFGAEKDEWANQRVAAAEAKAAAAEAKAAASEQPAQNDRTEEISPVPATSDEFFN